MDEDKNAAASLSGKSRKYLPLFVIFKDVRYHFDMFDVEQFLECWKSVMCSHLDI